MPEWRLKACTHIHKRDRETERKEREKIIEKYFLNRITVGLVVRPTFD